MTYPLFKGYILTDGKQAIEKFKNVDKFKTYREIHTNESFAGVLNENTILIDVDDEEQSNILFKIVHKKNYQLFFLALLILQVCMNL